jgi:hypothetical protein
MMDWIEDNIVFLVGSGMVLVIGGLISGAVWLAVGENDRRAQLMADCMHDGHKEYECYATIEKNTTPPQTTIFIPLAH